MPNGLGEPVGLPGDGSEYPWGFSCVTDATQEVEMPKSTKTNPKKTAPKKGSGAAEKIRQGKVELSDEELTKVSGGQSSAKRFTCIE